MLSPRAAAARDAYMKFRRLIHPEYRDSERWHKSWESAAAAVDGNGFDLDCYMEAQFYLVKPFPMPNHLYSEQAIKRYKAFVSTDMIGQEITAQVENELNYLETRRKLGFDLVGIITSQAAPFCVLFRYLSARMFQLPDLVREYELAAKEQASRYPNLAAAYKHVFDVGDVQWL